MQDALDLRRRGEALIATGKAMVQQAAETLARYDTLPPQQQQQQPGGREDAFRDSMRLSVAQRDVRNGRHACMGIAMVVAYQALFAWREPEGTTGEHLERQPEQVLQKLMEAGAALWSNWKRNTGCKADYPAFVDMKDACGDWVDELSIDEMCGYLMDEANQRANASEPVLKQWTQRYVTLEAAIASLQSDGAVRRDGERISAVLSCRDNAFAIWKRYHEPTVWLFDSHSLDEHGMPDNDGTAIRMTFVHTGELLRYLRKRFPVAKDESVHNSYGLRYTLHTLAPRRMMRD